jgi:hypothetical protein
MALSPSTHSKPRRLVGGVRDALDWPLALARIQRPERGREELDQHRSAPLLAPWDGTRGSGCDARRLSTAGLSATWRTMQASRAGAIRADAALRHGIMGNRRTPSRVRARGGCSITSPASFCYLIRSAAGQAVRIRRFLLFAMPQPFHAEKPSAIIGQNPEEPVQAGSPARSRSVRKTDPWTISFRTTEIVLQQSGRRIEAGRSRGGQS